METIIIGETTVVGNNIDADQIYPRCFLALTDPEEIESHYLNGVDENVAVSFLKRGIVVAETNFGCGSSREHAPIAPLHMGVPAVVADSFACILFRNSIDLGLPLVVCRGIGKKVKYGQALKLDLEDGTATVMEAGECWLCGKMGEQAFKILEADGIKPIMREGMKRGGE